LYSFAVADILKSLNIATKMPAVAGSKKGKKNVEAKAAAVEESESQVGHVGSH